MKKTYKRTLFFACVLLLSCFACKNGSTSNNPSDSPAIKETAKLKTLTIGTYVAKSGDIEKASKPEGFEKKFPADTSSVKIVPVEEDGGSVDFGTYSNTVTLTENVQTIIFKVKKEGKNDGIYTLKLSKEKATPPTPTETAKLKTLTIGDYSVSTTEIEKASKPEGFEKKFPASTSSVKILAVAEEGGRLDFGTYSDTVTLTESIQTIIFKVKKVGKNDGTYTLKLSKEKANPPMPTETAKLKTLVIGSYVAKSADIEAASKPEGFEKKFPASTSSVRIIAVGDGGASVDFGTYSDTVTLTESIQTVIFKVKKEGKNDGTYTLKLSKEKANPPTPTETAKLKTLMIGSYGASPAEIEKASKPEGFEKKFPADISSVKITAVAEDGGSVDFGTYSYTVTLTESIQTVIFKVKKEGKNDGTYTLKLSKEKNVPSTPQELKNLTATDFMGTFALDVEYNVINSTVTWEAFDGATHYEVFIDDERTNDVDNDGKLTETKFKTAKGLVDLDKKMGESEKSVKITVKALDDSEQVLASSSITKTLPKKSAIKSITFNDTPYTKDMKVKNPLNIKIEFTGNKIRFAGNSSKFDAYVKSYLVIEQGTDTILSNYAYDEASNIITISPQAGLNETKDYKFTIKQKFSDTFNMPYEKEEKTYSFKIEKSTEPALPPDVLKVLINDDSNLDIKDSEKTGINVESTVSIYFNQLIDTESYTPATEGESGNKGDGIYITNKETGKGFDESRLTEKKFETITESGKPITKATFKMVGKLEFYSTEPLKGNTAYYIVIDDVLRTAGNVKFSEKRFKFQTGVEKPVMHKFEVKDGIIVGKTDEPRNETQLKAGDLVTIQAVIPAGKTFKCWYIGEYATLTAEQKTANPMTFTMIDEDVHISATFE